MNTDSEETKAAPEEDAATNLDSNYQADEIQTETNTEPETTVAEPETKTETEETTEVTESEKPDVVAVKEPSKRKKLFMIVGFALAIIAILAAAFLFSRNNKVDAPAQTKQTVVKKFGVAVGLSEGLVQYSADAKAWKDLTADTDLKEGDSVRTATDGRVVLLIDDGSAVRLDSSSEIKLSDLSVTSILITNTSGEIYNRVVALDTRTYSVAVGDETYKAKGTAYRTFNETDKKGVEVFHSTVEAVDVKKDVTEGTYLFSKHSQKDKEGTVLALDIESLKSDSFIKWNSDQDKKVANYADKLGVLSELDKPAPTPAPAPKPTTSSGISLTGKQSEYSAVFSWKVTGVDTSKGFKLVRSKKTTTPTYPDNTVAYIDAGKTSYTLYVGEDTTYNYRICAYRGSSCDSYSNIVTVTTLKKVQETLQPGAVTLSLNGDILNWTIQGTAPFGYKVVVGTSSGPTYDNNYKKYFTESTTYDLTNGYLTDGTTYYVKVCKYLDGCTDYSNEIVYTP